MQQNVMDLTKHVPSRRNSACDLPTAPVCHPQTNRAQVNPSPATVAAPLCPIASSAVEPDFTRILNQKLTQQPVVVDLNNGVAGLDLPQLGRLRKLTRISAPVSAASDGLQDALYPAFLRRRFTSPKHQVVTEEVDRELISDEKDTKEASTLSALFKKTQEDDKGEVWNRLNELTTFALVGFDFSDVKIGDGARNRERKEAIIRQSVAERDAIWELGIRAPFGNRICAVAASLTWGTIDDTDVGEEVLLLPDRYPVAQEVYDRFAITGMKYEARGEQPTTLEYFARCTKQHIAIWCLCFGVHRKEERMTATHTLEKLHEAHPDLFSTAIIVEAWGEMTYRYIAEIKEDAWKMVRMLPATVRKGESRRKAVTPMQDGRSRWGYPATFLTERPTGFCQGIAVPRFEAKES